MKYRLVEWVSQWHGPVQVPNATILEGPIENALIVSIDDDMMQRLIGLGQDRLQAFVQRTRETIMEAGWKGEIIVCSSDMKFARFEPVTDFDVAVENVPSLEEVYADQSRALRELRDEIDGEIITRLQDEL